MKTVSSICAVAVCLFVCAVVAHDAEAASGRRGLDANDADKVPSPFRGVVSNVTATTLTIKGEVKARSRQPANGEPRSAAGEKAKETTVEHIVSFSIKPDTKITRDGKLSELKNIHRGEAVSVSFTTKENSSLKRVTEVAAGTSAEAEKEKPKGERKKKGKK